MNELKFFCPYCGQHIACDEAYAGRQTQCPACAGDLVVPPPPDADHRLRMAPASPRRPRQHRLYPVPSTIEPWTEEAWAKHVAEIDKRHRPQLSPWVRAVVVFLLILPSLASLAAAFWGKNWHPGDTLFGFFTVLFLFAIAMAAVATYVFEGSGQSYLASDWDPGDGVNVLLLFFGGLTLLLGDRPVLCPYWDSGRPWSWTRFWIGAVSLINFVVIFVCWLDEIG